jgi:hypothetical protein
LSADFTDALLATAFPVNARCLVSHDGSPV